MEECHPGGIAVRVVGSVRVWCGVFCACFLCVDCIRACLVRSKFIASAACVENGAAAWRWNVPHEMLPGCLAACVWQSRHARINEHTPNPQINFCWDRSARCFVSLLEMLALQGEKRYTLCSTAVPTNEKHTAHMFSRGVCVKRMHWSAMPVVRRKGTATMIRLG